MTREEAIEILKEERYLHLNAKVRKALNMGIKALEQQPIDMDMTKALILGLLLGIDKNPDEKDKLMEDLVKVFAPKQKMGHWIKVSMDKYVQHATAYYKCSECGGEIIGEHNYCPNCGCRMVEPQERKK